MLKLLIALGGLLIGVLLSYLASDEVVQRKYFVVVKYVLMVLLFLMVSYFLPYPVLLVFVVSALILFVLSIKINHPLLEIAVYIVVIVPYFLYLDPMARLVTASVLFVYGFPAGTLLRKSTV